MHCGMDMLIPHDLIGHAVSLTQTMFGVRRLLRLKFMLKVTHPLQKRRVRQIPTQCELDDECRMIRITSSCKTRVIQWAEFHFLVSTRQSTYILSKL